MKYEMKPLTAKEAEIIEKKLSENDLSAAPPEPGASDERFVLKTTDGDGNTVGGLIASFDKWGALELENLWIDERYRGQGIGSAIVCEAERAARERGCYLSIVSTWSYQARPLYEKHGYTLCSTVTDWPEGYDSYYLTKRLDRTSRGYVSQKARSRAIVPGGEADGEFIHRKLHEYNCSKVPRLHGHEAFEKKIVDDGGRMIAGCAADKDSLDITVLGMIWVDEAYRDRGLGSELLGEIEREIKAAGGIFTVAYVYDWSVGFFKKNGYTVCGAIEDHPKGHCEYVLKKIL